ncbi:MAG: protein-export membrane protein SecD [Candidatus Muproteobacteria bacterium RBG_16_62_13]|uniref:Protein translocase subunit SecD n=1 Tax=Candidatus Muproteobacteria bacterium RBG_16_62_13 TaxID=1817756 RepID=A0A1F6T552_9PROT|nr:MAG: protein-export membrane protein SecD [Candidatus Muproteobacteria bacterium RBG_16_62_13]
MNRFPLWKNLLVLVTLVIGLLYSLPNIYGEYPAVQVSATRTTRIDEASVARVKRALEQARVAYVEAKLVDKSVRIRFADTDTQIRARDVVQEDLGNEYIVALSLLPATPEWLQAIGAKPMFLGLDLRGGVHFLMQVDMRAVLKKAEETATDDARRILREKKVRYQTVTRGEGGSLEVRFRDAAERERGLKVLKTELRDVDFTEQPRGADLLLIGRFSDAALKEKKRFAVEQNITALNNRVNELGVAEPIIQQQGDDRIVVQLPGVQDTAKAKDILGRTATLEIRLVDEEAMTGSGQVPPGSKAYRSRHGGQIILKNQLVYSGDNITDATPGFDSQRNTAIVSITLDSRGAAINQRVTGENLQKHMAVVYIEIKSEPKLDANKKPVHDAQGRVVRESRRIEEVITAPVIRSQLGKRFQIEGLDNMQEANELSLLLRAGSLAAPVEIIEERTVGPSLGAENIQRGFQSTWIGFAAIIVFMIVYYHIFGVTSSLALGVNLLFLVALLSMMQATLTLPGMAGIALTLGMAIDANVLINERIREELRNGNTPHASIHAGYERAFGTILDSNLTTLIAGLALFTFGSGPVRGFAVVLCLGILTSMFSAVTVSRAMVNLVYGRRAKLERVAIGNTRWENPRPGQPPTS